MCLEAKKVYSLYIYCPTIKIINSRDILFTWHVPRLIYEKLQLFINSNIFTVKSEVRYLQGDASVFNNY